MRLRMTRRKRTLFLCTVAALLATALPPTVQAMRGRERERSHAQDEIQKELEIAAAEEREIAAAEEREMPWLRTIEPLLERESSLQSSRQTSRYEETTHGTASGSSRPVPRRLFKDSATHPASFSAESLHQVERHDDFVEENQAYLEQMPFSASNEPSLEPPTTWGKIVAALLHADINEAELHWNEMAVCDPQTAADIRYPITAFILRHGLDISIQMQGRRVHAEAIEHVVKFLNERKDPFQMAYEAAFSVARNPDTMALLSRAGVTVATGATSMSMMSAPLADDDSRGFTAMSTPVRESAWHARCTGARMRMRADGQSTVERPHSAAESSRAASAFTGMTMADSAGMSESESMEHASVYEKLREIDIELLEQSAPIEQHQPTTRAPRVRDARTLRFQSPPVAAHHGRLPIEPRQRMRCTPDKKLLLKVHERFLLAPELRYEPTLLGQRMEEAAAVFRDCSPYAMLRPMTHALASRDYGRLSMITDAPNRLGVDEKRFAAVVNRAVITSIEVDAAKVAAIVRRARYDPDLVGRWLVHFVVWEGHRLEVMRWLEESPQLIANNQRSMKNAMGNKFLD